jgi:hypothetical protein
VRVSRRWARSGRSAVDLDAGEVDEPVGLQAGESVGVGEAGVERGQRVAFEDLGFGGDGEQLAGPEQAVVVGGTQVGGLAQQLRQALEPSSFGVGRPGPHREQGVVVDPGLALRQRALQGGVGERDRRGMPTVQRGEQIEQRPELAAFDPAVRCQVEHPLQPGASGLDGVTQAGADLAGVVGGTGLPRDPVGRSTGSPVAVAARLGVVAVVVGHGPSVLVTTKCSNRCSLCVVENLLSARRPRRSAWCGAVLPLVEMRG